MFSKATIRDDTLILTSSDLQGLLTIRNAMLPDYPELTMPYGALALPLTQPPADALSEKLAARFADLALFFSGSNTQEQMAAGFIYALEEHDYIDIEEAERLIEQVAPRLLKPLNVTPTLY